MPGLRGPEDRTDGVVVHDAARPLATRALFDAVIAAVRNGADAAVPGIPVADTLKRVEDVNASPPPSTAGSSRCRHRRRSARPSSAPRTLEATKPPTTPRSWKPIGGHVVVVPGDPRNLKITTPDDLLVAAALLDAP